ncbi:hypothetical protein DFH09DRAFT_812170, partial [Mycena vulgaris]
SSNQHPFLALVAHYITNDGNLGKSWLENSAGYFLISVVEELLIDFRELVGEHSGENMAAEIWKTIEMYGLE